MAGQINISGSTEAVQLHGNDDYTVARDFTFPDESGELLIKDANDNVPGVGAINGGQLAGFRNLLINSTFGIWQRGTAGMPAPDQVRYYADRWASYKDAGAAVNDVQQIVDAPDIPGVTISTRTNDCDLRQVIEAGGFVYLKAGTSWTLSGWAKGNGAAGQLTPSVLFCADSNASPANTTVVHTGNAVAVGTDWTYWSTSFTVAANSPVGQDHVMVGISTTNDLFQTAIQLEPGLVPTPLEMRPIGTELALCQRYYTRVDASGSTQLASGFATQATLAIATAQLPVTMRAKGQFNTSGASTFAVSYLTTAQACTSLDALLADDNRTIQFAPRTTSLTGGHGIGFTANGNCWYDFDAEL